MIDMDSYYFFWRDFCSCLGLFCKDCLC